MPRGQDLSPGDHIWGCSAPGTDGVRFEALVLEVVAGEVVVAASLQVFEQLTKRLEAGRPGAAKQLATDVVTQKVGDLELVS